LADFESPDEIDIVNPTNKKAPKLSSQISKPTSLDSSYIIDSVPPDQLMADRSSEEDDDDLEFTEEDLEILPDEDEDMMDTSNPMRSNVFMSSNSRITPFMLFVKRTRPKLLESNPGLDYSSLTQTLIDIWSKMSSGEKFIWNQKLMKMTKPTQFQQNQSPLTQKVVKLVVQQPSNTNRSPQTVKTVSVTPYNKIPGLEPIDAAAHLKLLGESLSVIGQRLTAHKGQIAVSGSLSVLLDSMLCAMGPLLCLTKQVPELKNAIPQDKLNRTLDNIAYIMPGL